MREYSGIDALLRDLDQYLGIHIECSQGIEKEIFNSFYRSRGANGASYIMQSDHGYERQTVKSYLRFFEQVTDSRHSSKEVMRDFELEEIRKKKLRDCTASEHMRINFARISLIHSELCFLENPLNDIDAKSQKVILRWIAKRSEDGVKFVTTSPSLRYALLLPGTVFYKEGDRYIEIYEENAGAGNGGEEAVPQKVAAKTGTSTILFDPKDIDYIESQNKANFLSVRNSTYQVNYTLDELEEILKKYGFFRCHRSYIVNVQKVKEIEKWTKNSYSLRLNNMEHSQIPLAKGRVAEMKETYGW